MEGDGNLFPDGWFLDADDPSPAPPEADDPSEAPPARARARARPSPSSATTSPAVLQLPKQCYNFQPQCYNFHLGSTALPNH